MTAYWLRRVLWKNVLKDALLCGKGAVKIVHRKWYNPLRWIDGPISFKRVRLER